LTLLCGLPGAGKTTFAAALAARAGAVHLESDRVRRLLFGEPVFSSRENSAVFAAIRGAAAALLEQGAGVIIDSTNLTEADRTPFYRLADRAAVRLAVVSVEAPEEVIEKRLAARMDAPDGYSFADLDVYHRMKGRVQAISRDHLTVDTSDARAYELALDRLAGAERPSALARA
jgi:hypothetical protein